MKRDARIGMAVVLVFGLSVTLLIGRALYKRGGSGEMEGETADASATVKKPSDIDTLLNIPGPRGRDNGPLETTPGLISANNPEGSIPNDGPVRREGSEITAEDGPQPPAPGRDTPGARGDIYAYTVTGGDSPWRIASKVYGDGKYTQKIVEANGGTKAISMKPGSVIKIPVLANRPLLVKLPAYTEASAKAHAPVAANVVADGPHAKKDKAGKRDKTDEHAAAGKGTMYKIGKGDSLARIAKKNYGSSGPATIQLILAANKGLDAESLKAGQEIMLPAK